MKKIIILLFLLVNFLQNNAQPSFISSVKHGDPLFDNYPNTIVEYNGKLFITGIDYKNSSFSSDNEFLMCTDYLGNKIWEKKYSEKVRPKIFVTDNKLMLIERYGNKFVDSSFLLQINENGNILQKQSFKTPDNQYIDIDICIFTPENDIIIGAYKDTVDTFFDKFYGGSDYWLIRYKANSQLVWKKNIGGIYNDISRGLFKNTIDNSFNIVLSPYTLVISQLVHKEAKVVKMDYNGNVIWNTKANTDEDIRFHRSCDVDTEGNTYLAYMKRENTIVSTDMVFCKIDNKGKIEKEFRLSRNLIDGSLDGIAFGNNSIYVNMTCGECGYLSWKDNKVILPNNVNLYVYNNILKLNKNLVPQWAYGIDLLPQYSSLDSDISIPSAIIAKNGKIRFLNMRSPEFVAPPKIQQFDYWVTTIQDLDNFSKDCIKEATLYPNPTKLTQSDITLTFPNEYSKAIVLRFFDSIGRLIDTKSINVVGNKITYKPPTNISIGIYFLEIQCEDKKGFTKKIVITE